MVRVYVCLTTQHDPWLVLLALLICGLAAWTALNLARRSLDHCAQGAMVWSLAASIAAGSGVWATHFVAMLALDPGLPISYDVGLASFSIIASIAGAGFAFAAATRAEPRSRWIGILCLGADIAAMPYIGVAAVRLPATVFWDKGLVAASILVGAALASASLQLAFSGRGTLRMLAATLLLTCGICAEHLIGMAAVTVQPLPSLTVPGAGVGSPWWLALEVAAATCVVMVAALTALTIDTLLSRRVALETQRLQTLANATFEGLLIHAGGAVLDVNDSLLALLAYRRDDLIGRPVEQLLAEERRSQAAALLTVGSSEALETEFVGLDGRIVPVETLGRDIDYRSVPARVIAVRDISERRASAERIHRLAYHDALTDLPNRLLFREHLQLALARAAREGSLAILYLDLDRFKLVNDTLGHPAGDRLLIEAAKRLKQCVRGADIVARLGGDEFAIVQEHSSQPESAIALCRRLVDSLGRPFDIDGHSVTIGVSVGVVLASDADADGDTLLKSADMALYRAKADGRGTWRFYETNMDQLLQARHSLERELRQSLARDQFEVVYQPLIDVRSGAVTAFEALVRWHHPERGTVAPAEFIPVAEELGLMDAIGAWVLRRACADAVRWPAAPHVAVNLSPAQFRARDLPAVVAHALSASGLPASRLELEVTESVLIGDEATVMATLSALRALGVRIALDDFGTGYSSLSYLRRFPFDKLKIDQSFVSCLGESGDCCAIVRAVAGLGHSLGMTVNAEGVETEAQMAALRSESCDEVQGFLFSKPISNAEVPSLLARFDLANADLCAAD